MKRWSVALLAATALLAWSPPALADVTLTGTVGELGTFGNNNGRVIRFNFTDPNQTATCLDNGFGAKYAYFDTSNLYYKEIFAMLLVSKKGAAISCVVSNAQICQVQYCWLP